MEVKWGTVCMGEGRRWLAISFLLIVSVERVSMTQDLKGNLLYVVVVCLLL